MAAADPFHHVRDFGYFELPDFLARMIGLPPGDIKLWLPKLDLGFMELQLTKFMVLQVVAGLITLVIFRGLARNIRGGKPATGAWANCWESIALFLRDNVVRPTLGGHHDDHGHDDHGHDDHGHDDHGHDDHGHDAHGADHAAHGHDHHHAPAHAAAAHPEDKHLPFIWTCFFYILFCNLLGAVPMLGSATGNINVTGVLALMAFSYTFIVGAGELGAVGFFKNLVPPLDAPPAMKIFLVPMMFVIEVVGLLIKHGVLAVRLFANIMGGHTVIGVMLGFIAYPAVVDSWLWYLVTPASIAGQIGIGMLELFVAFLQAYVFAFLATIFVAMGSHPH
jgi:F-type H+-transporting ATPase subunit a